MALAWKALYGSDRDTGDMWQPLVLHARRSARPTRSQVINEIFDRVSFSVIFRRPPQRQSQSASESLCKL